MYWLNYEVYIFMFSWYVCYIFHWTLKTSQSSSFTRTVHLTKENQSLYLPMKKHFCSDFSADVDLGGDGGSHPLWRFIYTTHRLFTLFWKKRGIASAANYEFIHSCFTCFVWFFFTWASIDYGSRLSSQWQKSLWWISMFLGFVFYKSHCIVVNEVDENKV